MWIELVPKQLGLFFPIRVSKLYDYRQIIKRFDFSRIGTNVVLLALFAIVIWILPLLMMALMVTFIVVPAMPANLV